MKFRNITKNKFVVVVDTPVDMYNASRVLYKIIRPNQVLDFKGKAIESASNDERLEMIIEGAKEEIKEELIENNTKEIPKKRGRPKKIN